MRVEAEQQMFLAAMREASRRFMYTEPKWAHRFEFMDNPIAAVVYSPLGSKYKNRACVARIGSWDHVSAKLFNEYNPDFVEQRNGFTYFFYKEGQHVLAGTGAFAALRREAESAMLRDGG
jgi:hypothetical protein